MTDDARLRLQPHSSVPYAPAPAVLNMNQELRKERKPFALPDQSGHVAFFMPVHHYWYWVKRNPDLGASDPQIARNAWRKFLTSDEGRRYTVNPTEGKRMPTDGVIIK